MKYLDMDSIKAEIVNAIYRLTIFSLSELFQEKLFIANISNRDHFLNIITEFSSATFNIVQKLQQHNIFRKWKIG